MKRDYPVVMGTLYFLAYWSFAKLLNDLMYIWVDPRVQFEASRS